MVVLFSFFVWFFSTLTVLPCPWEAPRPGTGGGSGPTRVCWLRLRNSVLSEVRAEHVFVAAFQTLPNTFFSDVRTGPALFLWIGKGILHTLGRFWAVFLFYKGASFGCPRANPNFGFQDEHVVKFCGVKFTLKRKFSQEPNALISPILFFLPVRENPDWVIGHQVVAEHGLDRLLWGFVGDDKMKVVVKLSKVCRVHFAA